MGESLLDTNILIELAKDRKFEIKGFITIFNVIEFPRTDLFINLVILYPEQSEYFMSVFLARELRKMGKPLPAIDILIASICYNRKLSLISKDKHFNAIKKIWKDFKITTKL